MVQRFTIEPPEDATAEAPAIVANPLRIWEVTITGGDGSMFGSIDEYTLGLAPFEVSRSVEGDPTTFAVTSTDVSVREAQTRTLFVAVAPGTTSLGGTADFGGQSASFEITGPGAYVVKNGALEHAADVTVPTTGPSLAKCEVSSDFLMCAGPRHLAGQLP